MCHDALLDEGGVACFLLCLSEFSEWRRLGSCSAKVQARLCRLQWVRWPDRRDLQSFDDVLQENSCRKSVWRSLSPFVASYRAQVEVRTQQTNHAALLQQIRSIQLSIQSILYL